MGGAGTGKRRGRDGGGQPMEAAVRDMQDGERLLVVCGLVALLAWYLWFFVP